MTNGSMTTIDREELPAADARHPLPATLIPTAIRCHHCFGLSHREVEERLSGNEISVRYVCPECRAYSIRHYHDNH